MRKSSSHKYVIVTSSCRITASFVAQRASESLVSRQVQARVAQSDQLARVYLAAILGVNDTFIKAALHRGLYSFETQRARTQQGYLVDGLIEWHDTMLRKNARGHTERYVANQTIKYLDNQPGDAILVCCPLQAAPLWAEIADAPIIDIRVQPLKRNASIPVCAEAEVVVDAPFDIHVAADQCLRTVLREVLQGVR